MDNITVVPQPTVVVTASQEVSTVQIANQPAIVGVIPTVGALDSQVMAYVTGYCSNALAALDGGSY